MPIHTAKPRSALAASVMSEARSIKKPSAIRPEAVRFHASRVHSAAKSTRGSLRSLNPGGRELPRAFARAQVADLCGYFRLVPDLADRREQRRDNGIVLAAARVDKRKLRSRGGALPDAHLAVRLGGARGIL